MEFAQGSCPVIACGLTAPFCSGEVKFESLKIIFPRLSCEQGPGGNPKAGERGVCSGSQSEVVAGVTAGMGVQTVAAQTKAASFQRFQTGPGSTPLANPELTSSTVAGVD